MIEDLGEKKSLDPGPGKPSGRPMKKERGRNAMENAWESKRIPFLLRRKSNSRTVAGKKGRDALIRGGKRRGKQSGKGGPRWSGMISYEIRMHPQIRGMLGTPMKESGSSRGQKSSLKELEKKALTLRRTSGQEVQKKGDGSSDFRKMNSPFDGGGTPPSGTKKEGKKKGRVNKGPAFGKINRKGKNGGKCARSLLLKRKTIICNVRHVWGGQQGKEKGGKGGSKGMKRGRMGVCRTQETGKKKGGGRKTAMGEVTVLYHSP